MKILIVGGSQFTTRIIAERFAAEKVDLLWLDESSNSMNDDIAMGVLCIPICYSQPECESVFKNHKIDTVIFFGEPSCIAIDTLSTRDMNTHVNGLMSITSYCIDYNIKRFIYISTTNLYDRSVSAFTNVPDETCKTEPTDIWTLGHDTSEKYLLNIDALYNIDLVILRISTLYGSTQDKLDGPIAYLINSKNTKKENKIIDWISNQQFDLLHSQDFCEAIFLSTYSPSTGVFNICSGREYLAKDLVQFINAVRSEKPDIKLSKGAKSYSYDRASQYFDFTPKVSLQSGLVKILESKHDTRLSKNKTVKNKKNKTSVESSNIGFNRNKAPFILQTIENIILFAIVAYFYIIEQQTLILNWIDIRLLYISFISIQFGLRQSIISSGLCILLLVYQYILYQTSLLTLIYNSTDMVAIFMFIFIGVMLGYMVDRRKNYIIELEKRHNNLESQLMHTKIMYTESLRIKDSLQQQIYGFDDSFGKICNIVSKLDSLAIEELNTAIVTVTEEIMNSRAVSLYYVGKNTQYLRLMSHSPSLPQLPTSLKIEESSPLYDVIHTQQPYTNRSALKQSKYLMISPIIDNSQVIAVIILHEAPLKYLTLQYENMFYLTTRLINQSIVLAYAYQQAILDEQCIGDTIILKEPYFSKILNQKQSQKKYGSSDFTLLRLLEKDPLKISEILSTMIRQFDYLGVASDGHYYVLLSNTMPIHANTVISRFKQKGIHAVSCHENIA